MKKNKLKCLISGIVSSALAINTLSVLPAFAAEDSDVSPYPYTIFAGSSDDGAITTTAYNFNINGNIGTNGTIVAAENMNVNGQRKEHLSEDMPIIFDEINNAFFSENVESYTDDYSYTDTNISVSVPLDVNGELDLSGNITITTGVKAYGDIELSGEVENTDNSVIVSQTGNITMNSTNVSLMGLIYAPFGTVYITAQNLNLNSVVIIADKVCINAPNVNANNSTAMSEFIGGAISNTDAGTDTDHENHENETPEFTPVIYAFGDISKDNTEIVINWYSNLNGEYVIYESDDNESYEDIATVSDEESYTYTITDGFELKYFKVSVNDLDKSAVSIPFIVKRTSNGYVCELLDSDEDKLADVYEQLIGTDANDEDTDNDTLTDYEEVYITGTDPLVYDSDTTGVSDADADSDGDGLTNRQEIDLGANPQKADTDGDTLSDGDEVNIYHTDPLVPDTDGDGLCDGDEVLFGEDPLDEDSDDNGISDGQEKRMQTFTHEVENKDCAVTEVTVTMDATGNINNTTEIESIMDKDYMCSRVVGLIGEPFSIETTSDFTEATLTYKVDQTKLGDTEFDNLMFLWYDEENDNFVELETEHDILSSSVSITTTHFSKYCIVDSKTWFENWKMIAEKINGSSPSIATAFIVKCQNSKDPYFDFDYYDENGEVTNTIRTNYRSLIIDNIIDTMSDKDMLGFVYYQSAGGMFNGFESDKDEINSLKENYFSNLSLGGFNTLSNMSYGIAIAASSLVYDASDSAKRIIIITDSDLTFNELYLKSLKANPIPVYFFCIGDFKTTNIQALADDTGGDVFQIVDYEEPETVKETVCYMEQVEKEKASRNTDNTPNHSDEDEFYDEQEIDGLIYNSCGERVYTDYLKGDTDGDGLLDSEEVSVYISYEDVQLENPYYYDRKYYHQMYSDPNREDTDGDGFTDDIDPNQRESDIKVEELSRKAYININYNGKLGWDINRENTISYGGNQHWFLDYLDDEVITSSLYSELGCGLISVTDLLLYLSTNDLYRDFDKLGLYDSYEDIFNYNEYLQFAWDLGNDFPVIPILGVIPYNLTYKLNDYLNKHYSYNYSVYWNKTIEPEEYYDNIKEMIKNDIPVLISYDKTIQNFVGGFVADEGDNYKASINIYETDSYLHYYLRSTAESHYMNVTGIINYSDDVKMKLVDNEGKPYETMLQVSNGGEKRYIRLSALLENLSYTSNMLYIVRS